MEQLLRKYKNYHPSPEADLLEKAYKLAELAYHGEYRKSGVPWINYITNVAHLAADFRMDTATLCAALLYHGYNFGLTPEDVEKEVSQDVRYLLDNIRDLRTLASKHRDSFSDVEYANYMRRIILTVGKDLRAVLLRLVERLAALEGSEFLDEAHRNRILNHALHLYSPLADMIGVYELRWRLEDTAFKALHPEEYGWMQTAVSKHPYANSKMLRIIQKKISTSLKEHDIIPVNLFGRTKKPYSLYKKMQRYMSRFKLDDANALARVRDKVALTIIVDNIESCYKTLDTLHKKFSYSEEDLDDYIQRPRPNGYRSLQTTLEIEPSVFIEVQIRTTEMHEYNEMGPASHVSYKLYGHKVLSTQKLDILKRLLSWRDTFVLHAQNNTALTDLENTIFVFTPKGDVRELPKDATPIDFAYTIHQDIGNSAVMARVDGALKPLNFKLQNGQVVEILTNSSRKGPSIDWLDFVKTKDARIAIKRKALRKF